MLERGMTSFSKAEKNLFIKLQSEKQFISDEDRALLENKMLKIGHFDTDNEYSDNFCFSVGITDSCNMKCVYCYASSRRNDGVYLKKEHIDNIFEFFYTKADDRDKILSTSQIRITGGEPLMDDNTVGALMYLAAKWPNAKLILYTNGVNLLKYYDRLPLNRLEMVQVSLDSTKEIHMHRRYSGFNIDSMIYDNIILGIKRLLNDGVKVKISSVLDKSCYKEYFDLKDFLSRQGISDHINFEHDLGIVNDFENSLDLREDLNNKYDVFEMREYFIGLGESGSPGFFGTTKLSEMILRPKNTPFFPKHQRCNSKILSNYYFACDGNVYFCDCPKAGVGAVGTYYPHISLDDEAVSKLLNRSVINSDKCKSCAYKFVCLGGCPMSSTIKGEDMSCGPFADEEIMDNIELNYAWIPDKVEEGYL